MAQVTTGLYRAVGIPLLYKLIQSGLAKPDALKLIAHELVGANPGNAVLDLGCGSAAILAKLPAGVRYHGLDTNPLHIDAARRAYGSRGVFEVGDAARLGALAGAKFDIVLMVGLLHHLDDDEADAALAGAVEALSPNGRLFAIDPAWEPGQHPFARFLISCDSGRSVRDRRGYKALAMPHFARVQTNLLTGLLRLPYTHCVLEAWREDTAQSQAKHA